MSDNNSKSGGIGFLGLLAIVFITLKLCKVIAWSWWWVTCPLWAIPAIWLLICVATLFIALSAKVCSTTKQKEQMKRIMDDQKQNAGKSKWQQRVEKMQEANKLRENK